MRALVHREAARHPAARIPAERCLPADHFAFGIGYRDGTILGINPHRQLLRGEKKAALRIFPAGLYRLLPWQYAGRCRPVRTSIERQLDAEQMLIEKGQRQIPPVPDAEISSVELLHAAYRADPASLRRGRPAVQFLRMYRLTCRHCTLSLSPPHRVTLFLRL